MKTSHLYQRSSTGKIKNLLITADEGKLVTEWWTVDANGKESKHQSTTETVKGVNAGKANETTPEQQAEYELDRKVTKKTDEGYSTEVPDDVEEQSVDLTKPLPSNFAPAKPISEKPETALDGTWLAERKINGICLIFQNTGTEHIIYSRRMNVITNIVACVPDVVKKLKALPKHSIVIGEIVAHDKNGKEDKSVLAGITSDKTTPAKAAARYAELVERGYTVEYCPYEIYAHKGEFTTELPFLDRCALTEEIFGIDRHIIPLTQKAVDAALKKGWEGYIIRQADSTIKFSLDGKAKRFGGHKYKFVFTTDAVVVGISPGAGKHEQRIARFYLAQYDAKGNTVKCGWCGLGRLGEKAADALTEELLAKGYNLDGEQSLYPADYFAVELEYQSRLKENDKGERCFEFPIIIEDGIRYDKPLIECEME